MRLGAWATATFVAGSLIGCSADSAPPAEDEQPRLLTSAKLPGSEDPSTSAGSPTTQSTSTSANKPAPPPPIDPATLTHPEVVYVIMPGKDGLIWFCTGTLIAKDVVLTAAHCLQPELFLSWEVLAPTLPARPRVKVAKTTMYDTKWRDVDHPDIGILKLEAPIELPRYAQLTDVTGKVEAAETLMGQTIIRKSELPESPFRKTAAFKITSTIQYGYDHGYGVPMYSHGGDSGAGVFLVEEGAMTHKLVGIEREPDPARKIDHLTRIESSFVDWVAANSK